MNVTSEEIAYIKRMSLKADEVIEDIKNTTIDHGANYIYYTGFLDSVKSYIKVCKSQACREEPKPDIPDDTPIIDLGLTTRTLNGLYKLKVATFKELKSLDWVAFKSIRGVGEVSVYEVEKLLNRR